MRSPGPTAASVSMCSASLPKSSAWRFHERVALEFALHRRTGRPLSVLMLDLDHFKQVNDQLGHAMGDEYLRRVASELKGYCRRPTDLLARYGGEEIICLLPETAQPEAIQIAEKMREADRKSTRLNSSHVRTSYAALCVK